MLNIIHLKYQLLGKGRSTRNESSGNSVDGVAFISDYRWVTSNVVRPNIYSFYLLNSVIEQQIGRVGSAVSEQLVRSVQSPSSLIFEEREADLFTLDETWSLGIYS